MKSIVFLAVFSFLFLNAYSQTNKTHHLGLGIRIVDSTENKTFVFKPNKSLKIMTVGKMKYKSGHYTFSDKFIVMDMKDTILFDNISKIQGQVYNDGGRKVLGVILTLVAIPFVFFGIGEGVTGDPVALIVAVPFIGMGYGGLRLIGPRRFQISQECYIKVIENQNP